MGGLWSPIHLSGVGLLLSEPPELTPTGFGAALLKMVAALVLVCVLAYVALRLARRHLVARQTQRSTMRVVERCPLSARQSLWIVEVGGRYFLIGATEGAIAKLAELDEEQVNAIRADAPPAPRSFWETLRGGPSGKEKGEDKGKGEGS
jgi:flagellar biosynthetic protein FliO